VADGAQITPEHISPAPPVAGFALPWDDPDAPDPVPALAAARAELGDTFLVESGRERYLFVFSPDAVRELYAVPEAVASKGLADYRMLLRKLPKELFADRRTFAHDLFGAQDVEDYLGHLDIAITRQIDELGDEGTFDVFALARRLGHRLALGCWMGDAAAEPPMLDALIAAFEVLDGADAFVRPAAAARAGDDRVAERAALARLETIVGGLLAGNVPEDGFLAEIDRRWGGTEGEARVAGVTGDVVLLHIATMTNLFAALGWTLALVLLDDDVRVRIEAGDDTLLERSALEATRLGQRSIMMRSVLAPWTIPDGDRSYHVEPGAIVATMVPLTNTTAAPGLDGFDPDRWAGRKLRDEAALPTPELVVTFGHGPHRCPARRFSLSAIGGAVRRLLDAYDLTPEFDTVRPQPGQIGGVARAADPCPVRYLRRAQ
jgi:cytochrome P450